MNMLAKILKSANSVEPIKDEKVEEEINVTKIVEEPIIPTETTETTETETVEKIYKITFGGKKYKVHAENEETAIKKVKEYNNLQDVEFNITIEDIFSAITSEIERIVTVAHPEVVTNSYDRWVAVLTEELGEIVHEINDEFEGKKANKNTFVECVQLASATILLAKKFANEHKEIFDEEKK